MFSLLTIIPRRSIILLNENRGIMKKIGITGGIGSGKTTVCEIFKLLGIPVFHADPEAKLLQNSDEGIKQHIINLLGADVCGEDGLPDRQKVAKLVFSDPKLLASLNGIIHPVVRERFLKWCEDFQAAPYILYEAAILFESGFASDFDRTILVLADENLRIARVVRRNHTTEEDVRQRISNQMTDSEKIKKADFIVVNNQDDLVIPQILKIDKLIREDGKNW